MPDAVPPVLPPEPSDSLLARAQSLREHLTWTRLVLSAATVVLALVAGWWLLRAPEPPVEDTLPRAQPTRSSASSPVAPEGVDRPPAVAGAVVVQVAGAVRRPGVYRLPAGARVVDLLEAAGGPTPQGRADALSLAAVLRDGDRVVVPGVGDPDPPPPTARAGAPGAAEATGPVDLNQATAAELDTLPGVGPATAAAIVTFRDQHGGFQSVEELGEVPGIGPVRLERLRPLVTVEVP